MGNANYNALQLTLKRTTGPLTLLASYTFGKSLDWAASVRRQVYPLQLPNGVRALGLGHQAELRGHLQLRPPGHEALRTSQSMDGRVGALGNHLPVTFATFDDMHWSMFRTTGSTPVSIDLPNYTPGDFEINHNPRNGRPCFNTAIFTPNTLGKQANAKRRFFCGPGINDFDMAHHKLTKITESNALEFGSRCSIRSTAPSFIPNGSVDGNINNPNFRRRAEGSAASNGSNSVEFNF